MWHAAYFDLTQFVLASTLKDGHSFDLIIIWESDNIICDIGVTEVCIISGHSAVHFKIKLAKPGI